MTNDQIQNDTIALSFPFVPAKPSGVIVNLNENSTPCDCKVELLYQLMDGMICLINKFALHKPITNPARPRSVYITLLPGEYNKI